MNNVFYMIEADHRTHGTAATQRIVAEKVSSRFFIGGNQAKRTGGFR
jgi:hypothetical protein